MIESACRIPFQRAFYCRTIVKLHRKKQKGSSNENEEKVMISSILAAGGDCFGRVSGVSGNHPVVELLQKHRFKRPENKKYPAAYATKHLQSFVLNDGVPFIELITGDADGMNQTAVGAKLAAKKLDLSVDGTV